MRALKLALAAAALSVLPGAAGAATLDLIGSGYTERTLGGGFDLGVGLQSSTVKVLNWSNKSGSGLAVDGPANVTYTYLGKEAGYTNGLVHGASSVFSTASSSLGNVSGSFSVLGGLLPFMLTSNGQDVANDGGADKAMNIAYLLFNAGKSALVFLDDFGAGPDADFDDIGIRIDISDIIATEPLAPAPVPLPPAAVLLLTAVGGLGLLGRRRRVTEV